LFFTAGHKLFGTVDLEASEHFDLEIQMHHVQFKLVLRLALSEQ
jgi:hypothetical protein